MTPDRLDGWTIEAVEQLCTLGLGEGERHDFKFGLQDRTNTTKICCAFANSFGGFIAFGVKETDDKKFSPVGMPPDIEFMAKLNGRIKAEPEIKLLGPKILPANSGALIYIVEVPESVRKPHYPTTQGDRKFWKRRGPACEEMTLEEVRFQMTSAQEKRDKLTLLLIELAHMSQSFGEQVTYDDGIFDGALFSFEIIDRVIVEAYSIISGDRIVVGGLFTLKRLISHINSEKQKMLAILAQAYDNDYKRAVITEFRNNLRRLQSQFLELIDQVRHRLAEKYSVVDPYT